MSLRKSIKEMFDNFFLKSFFLTKFPSIWKDKFGIWNPEINIYEKDREVIVKINVLRYKKKDIKINVDNSVLTVSGGTKEKKELKKRSFYQKKHQYGFFQKSVNLPHYADLIKIETICNDGVFKKTFLKS